MSDSDPAIGHPRRIDWREVGILLRRELRAALRERNIVINSILVPLLLYPFMLWVGFTGIMFVQGQTQDFVSRVQVAEWPDGHPGLRGLFRRSEKIDLTDAAPAAAAEAEKRIEAGELDAWVEFLPADDAGAALAENFRVRIAFDKSKDRSKTARDRIGEVIARYRSEWLEREAVARGLTPAEWRVFTLTTKNVASARQIGAFILGRILPVFFVVAIALGCFHPAIDTTAGERERGTWETLMSTAAGRTSIGAAKFLYVAIMGGTAGLLNIAMLAATLKPIFAPILGDARDAISFAVPLSALPVIALAAVLLGGFVAAGMLVFAAFARTFKEGQSMITPFFMIMMLPVMFLQVPGLEFSLALAAVPVVNIVMMVRSALMHEFLGLPFAVTVAVSVAVIAACVRLAAFILSHEDVVLGTREGGLQSFLKEHLFRRPRRAAGLPQSP